jgi:hypothetical protein
VSSARISGAEHPISQIVGKAQYMLNLNIGLLHMLFNHIKLTYAFTIVQGEVKITSAFKLPSIKIWMACAI